MSNGLVPADVGLSWQPVVPLLVVMSCQLLGFVSRMYSPDVGCLAGYTSRFSLIAPAMSTVCFFCLQCLKASNNEAKMARSLCIGLRLC